MKKRERRDLGFTLVELVVVMVIVGILATISIPMYRNYVERARASEGRALVGSVASALRLHHSEYGRYGEAGDDHMGENTAALGVDASANQYFRTFWITANTDDHDFEITTRGVEDGDADDIRISARGSDGSTDATYDAPLDIVITYDGEEPSFD